MVISRPCEHPECPRRDGFIRGQYESVEFIREIPLKPNKAASTTDLLKTYSGSPSLEKKAILRSAEKVVKGSSESLPNGDHLSPAAAEEIVREGRQRGKTISFAGSRGSSAKGEAMDNPHAHDDDEEMNPVEWIMITRSDPGGSVPRFMVERGTPGSIVADASKFLDWACKKEHPEDEIEALEKGDTDLLKQKTREELEAYNTNGHLAGLEGTKASEDGERPAVAVPRRASLEIAPEVPPSQEPQQGGLLSTISGAAYAGLETYAPQAVIDRLPGHQQSPSMSTSIASAKGATRLPLGTKSTNPTPSISSSSSSIASFASAEDHFDDTSSLKSTTSATATKSSSNSKLSPHEKELAKLNDRKRALNENLAKAREKETKDKESLNLKEEERIKKAEEKHAKEVAKQEEKYKKEVARLEAKRVKEAAKMEERRKKAEDKDEKARLVREKEEMRQELEVVSKERDILREQVGALQRENTALVVKMGKMEGGKDMLLQVKGEAEGNRSGSGSLRSGKGGTPENAKEATVLAGSGEKKDVVEAMK